MDEEQQTAQALRALELVRRTSAALRRNPPDIRSALADYQATAAADPKNVELLRCYGVFLAGLGDRVNAAQTFERALMVDPNSEVVLLEYAKILSYGLSPNDELGTHDTEYAKELQRAFELVDTLLEVNPHNDEGLMLRSSISATLADLGHPETVQKSLQQPQPQSAQHHSQSAAVPSAAQPTQGNTEGDDSDDEELSRLGKRLGLNDQGKPKRRYKFFCVPIPML